MLSGLGGTLTEYQRSALLEVAPFWTRKNSPEQLRKIMGEILSCFEYWKVNQADSAGQVKVFHPLTIEQLSSYPDGKLTPMKGVAPWHCAGPFVQNEIDLAFKLWLDSDAPFDAVLNKHGTCQVFALCGGLAIRRKDVDADSLIRLNGFLSEHLVVYADMASEWIIKNSKSSEQRRRQDEGLKTAREISAQKRSEKARQQHENIRRMAYEYFRSRPADNVEAAIAHIGKYVRLSPSTILATIKGVRAEALRSLNRDHPK
jgi:hypothetical protein